MKQLSKNMEAAQTFEQAINVARIAENKYHIEALPALIRLASTRLNLSQTAKAQQALDIAEQLIEANDGGEDLSGLEIPPLIAKYPKPEGKIEFYDLQSDLLEMKRDYAKAIEWRDKARLYSQSIAERGSYARETLMEANLLEKASKSQAAAKLMDSLAKEQFTFVNTSGDFGMAIELYRSLNSWYEVHGPQELASKFGKLMQYYKEQQLHLDNVKQK